MVQQLWKIAVALVLCAVAVNAFTSPFAGVKVTAPAAAKSTRRSPTTMVASWFKPAAAKKDTTAEAVALKQVIIDAARGTDNGTKASDAQREAIKGAVNKLVKLNPTKAPAKSGKNSGVWKLVYTTTPGSSAGKLGPFVGAVTQDVDVDAVKYTNIVDLGPVRGVLDATWTVENASQWRVVFQSIKFSAAGVTLVDKPIEGAVGIWTLLYLDDTVRILTARNVDRAEGNLYILAKK